MHFESENIADWIFRRNIKVDAGKITMSPQVLAILMKLDGTRTVAAVARESKVTMMAMRKLLSKLHQHHLIEPVLKAEDALDPLFMDRLKTRLAEAIGPVADMVINDTLQDLGLSPHHLPRARGPELIDRLAGRILVDEAKQKFRKMMTQALASES